MRHAQHHWLPFPIAFSEYSWAAVIPLRECVGIMAFPPTSCDASAELGDVIGGGAMGFSAGGGALTAPGIKGVAIGGGGTMPDLAGGGGTP